MYSLATVLNLLFVMPGDCEQITFENLKRSICVVTNTTLRLGFAIGIMHNCKYFFVIFSCLYKCMLLLNFNFLIINHLN